MQPKLIYAPATSAMKKIFDAGQSALAPPAAAICAPLKIVNYYGIHICWSSTIISRRVSAQSMERRRHATCTYMTGSNVSTATLSSNPRWYAQHGH